MAITDADIELIIDRKRGLGDSGEVTDLTNNTASTFTGTQVQQTAEELGELKAFEERLKENQQLGLDDFDESTPLIDIKLVEDKMKAKGGFKSGNLADAYREEQSNIINGKRKSNVQKF